MTVIEAQGCIGIILLGGSGTRMAPMTTAASKQVLPLYDKPMCHYPMTTLIEGGIRKVVIVSQTDNLVGYQRLYGDGSAFGMKISYVSQDRPGGLAEPFILAGDFIPGNKRVCMILGDNIFHGPDMGELLGEALDRGGDKAVIFTTRVKDPQRYGVAEFDDNGDVINIVEKPTEPKSSWAVTGLYVYPADVVGVAEGLKPSARGELEITDVNNVYRNRGQLACIKLSQGTAWLDSGTPEALLAASGYVHAIQERQGVMVGCPEAAAFHNGWIGRPRLLAKSKQFPNDYGDYLRRLATGEE